MYTDHGYKILFHVSLKFDDRNRHMLDLEKQMQKALPVLEFG